jgi:hypothetical protein
MMTLENVTNAIKQLEAINPLEEFAYEKALFAYKTIKYLPILIHELPDDLRLCRSRTHSTPDVFKTVSEISKPSYQLVKEFARCNRPFQTKFYAGETRPTAFMELANYWAETKNFGDKFYVTTGVWFTQKSLMSIIVASPDAETRTSEFDKGYGANLDEFINQYDGEFKEAMILFYRFLANRFRKPAKHDPLTYIITTAYCNIALLDGKADCILYPSVPFGQQGVNFAISAEFIKPENIIIQGAVCNELTVSKNELGAHSFKETGRQHASEIVKHSDIIW